MEQNSKGLNDGASDPGTRRTTAQSVTSSFLPQLIRNTIVSSASMNFPSIFSSPSSSLSSTYVSDLMVGSQFATKSRPPPPLPNLYLDETSAFKSQHRMGADESVYNMPLTNLVPIPIVLDENFVIRQREPRTEPSVLHHHSSIMLKACSDDAMENQSLQYSLVDQQELLLLPDQDQSSDLNIPNDTVDSQRLTYLEEVAVKAISEFNPGMARGMHHMSLPVEQDDVLQNTLRAVDEPERILYEHDYGSRKALQLQNEPKTTFSDSESDEDVNFAMKVLSRKRAVADCCDLKCCRCSTSFSHKCKRKGRRGATSKAKRDMLLKRRRFVAPPTEHTCPKCSKKLYGKTSLKEHLATHARQNTFACPLCERIFNCRRIFHRHIATHNPNHVAEKPKLKPRVKPRQKQSAPEPANDEPMDEIMSDRDEIGINNTPDFAEEEQLNKVEEIANKDITAASADQPKRKLESDEVGTAVFSVRSFARNPLPKRKSAARAAKNTSIVPVKDREEGEPVVEVNEQDGTYDLPGDHASSDDGEVYRVEDQNWDCNLCKAKCKSRTELVEHQSVEHEEDAVHACAVCCRRFRRKAQMTRHMLIHTGIRAFECDVCNEQFSRRHHLDRHKLRHGVDRPFECQHCQKKFIRANQLELHRSRNVCSKTLITCPICSKKFLYELAMEKHLNKHTKDSDLTCYKCDIKFSDPAELTKHKTQAHRREKAFTCEVCKKTFSQEVYLKKHLTIHWGSTPFSCPQCSRGFLTNGDLQRHIKTHDNPVDLTCHVCNKTFNRKDLLQNHMLRHSGERQFTCETCGKSFYLQKHLKQHKYSHLAEKPFCCETCGKTFTLNHNLQQHKLIHTGHRPFVCEECGRGFMRNDQLQKHKGTAHAPVSEQTLPNQSKPEANQIIVHHQPPPRYTPQSIHVHQTQSLPELHVLQSVAQPSIAGSKHYFVSTTPHIYEAKKYDPMKYETGKFDLGASGHNLNIMSEKLEPATITGLIPPATILMSSSLGLHGQSSSSNSQSQQEGFQYLQLSSYHHGAHSSADQRGEN